MYSPHPTPYFYFEHLLQICLTSLYWAIPVFVWPPGMEDLEFQLHFLSSNPMEDCGFVDVFDNPIHGKQILNGLAGYRRHWIYIYIGDVIHRYFHGFFLTLMMPSIGISQKKKWNATQFCDPSLEFHGFPWKKLNFLGVIHGYFHGKCAIKRMSSIGNSMEFFSNEGGHP